MEAEVMEPLEIPFSDLLLLSSPATSSRVSPEEQQRLESLSSSVMQALGTSGPGLLSVAGVPRASGLRKALLPLSSKLALLGNKERARVLKEHVLGSDVSLKNLNRIVSSFASQLKYERRTSLDLFSSGPSSIEEDSSNAYAIPTVHMQQEIHDDEFKQLGETFKELGHFMMELGLRLAQICDKAIGGRELVQSIIDSFTAKARLIHYHSTLDNLVLKESEKKTKGSTKKNGLVTSSASHSYGSTTLRNKILPKTRIQSVAVPSKNEHMHNQNGSVGVFHGRNSFSNLWQQWHYDYGIFTVLTTPSFMMSCPAEDSSCMSSSQDCPSPDGHTYLQLFDTKKNKILVVKSSPESFIIQVGEAAAILSKGKLHSTLHSVGRPLELQNLSRETFVVFLQPAWTKTLSYSGHLNDETASHKKSASSKGASKSCSMENASPGTVAIGSQESHQLMQDILKKIPPLSSRLRDGMTFAEFSRQTTKQYYGGSGSQSGRE